ncbi:hypothetical protein [Halorubrum pallidum]|uniref:Class I SAM-dependent methyltransferase n=1 Tax=Halorubrum pallidum TaxID=1526114 RepID=A0ABD5T8S4_9EURY
MIQKIQKAVRDPSKIPTYFQWVYRTKFLSNYHRYIRSRGASIYRDSGDWQPQTDVHHSIRETVFGDLKLNDQDRTAFRTYLKVCDLANYLGCESVLEIGAGLSTAIWADFSERTGASVTSIDADFDRFDRWIAGTRHERAITDHVQTKEGVSIDPEELRQFYANSHTEYADIPVTAIASDLDQFARAAGCPARHVDLNRSLVSRRAWSASDVIVSDEKLRFPKKFLNYYVKGTDSFDELVEMLGDVEQTNVIEDLTNMGNGWDLIWFDSGEVSSMVEWKQLKSHINPGGIAAFHDIFFPKSMKNFVVGATLLNDPNWEIILVEESTRQGLLLAQKRT